MQQLTWRAYPAKTPKLARHCTKCGSDAYINSHCFRVNANGNRLDVWLIYRCEKCKGTWNLTIFERVAPQTIDKELYELFLANDEDLALKYSVNPDFLHRNNAVPEKASSILVIEGELPSESDCRITIAPDYPTAISPGAAISEKLGISRSALKKLELKGAFSSERDIWKTTLAAPLTFELHEMAREVSQPEKPAEL